MGRRRRIARLRNTFFLFFCAWIILLMSVALCEEVPETPSPEAPEIRKVVYLTFDDGPCPRTFDLLDTLKREGVPATFFLIGDQLRNFPEAVRTIYEDGHAIGCHSYYHQRSLMLTPDGFRRETARFDKVLEEVLGFPLEVRVFRFPFGSSNSTSEVRRYATQHGYLWIDWNASNYDTDREVAKSTEAMLAAAVRTSRNKDIVVLLMHENASRVVEMLPPLIQHYREEGYEFDVLTPDFEHRLTNLYMGLPKTGKAQ